MSKKRVKELEEYIRWMAQTVHQAYHTDDPGAWDGDCPKDICASTRNLFNVTPSAATGEEEE